MKMPAPGKINVIGGCGAMGKMFVKLFVDMGYEVGIFDTRKGDVDPAEAADADVVFFAVSISTVEDAIAEIGPHMSEKSLAVDIASVKTGPLEAMMKHCRGEVLGGHPLFGPSVEDFAGEVFFLCPGRGGPLCDWFEGLLEKCGMKVITVSAEQHDRQMGVVQSLRHLMLAGFGATVNKFGAGEKENTGRWFGGLDEMRENQASQPAELYADIALNNPFSREIFKDFANNVEKMKKALDNSDRKAMIGLLNEIL